MKKIIFLISLFTSLSCLSQAKETGFFVVSNDTIEYTRLDYSKYSVASIYINMYEETPATRVVKLNAINFLKRFHNLYHTLYFFIQLPEKKFTKQEKEIIFSEFNKQIIFKENLPEADLYLNFDEDYSQSYQEEMLKNKSENKIKRIYTDINSTIITKILFN